MSMQYDHEHLQQILETARNSACEFLESLATRPVGRNLQTLPHDTLPEEGMGAEGAIAAFRQKYEDLLSASAGPRYLGFVTGGSTPAAVVGDWLVSAYDQNLAVDGDSIAMTVERETLGLLRELFGLPDTFEGAFVTGATMANFVALGTARQWAGERLGIDISEEGLWQLPPVPLLGGSPHASAIKALSMLGIGRKVVEYIPRLPGRMAVDPHALEERLAKLNGAPAIVIASAGEVNTGDFDDLESVATLCQQYGAWLHVDGAFGLFAACDPAHAHLLRGLEAADSITADGHKWLNVPYDSGFVFTRHLRLNQQVFKISAAYLGDNAPDLSNRTPEDSRRFRALPAWMTLMAYGKAGYREMVARCCSLAQQLGEGIEQSPHFELLAPVRLNIVCFALRGADVERRNRFLEALKEDGRALLTPTTFDGKPAIRAAFSNWSTSERDIPVILSALEECSKL
ncbi:MAG TPA: aminotransferase class V-fold PLP-dependent enzyme [Ktedonobacteraceae bacterium]|nr:aminotransferase class V-fold PLP-dependent enzyme [Ktedonobacteraceae bacterium]